MTKKGIETETEGLEGKEVLHETPSINNANVGTQCGITPGSTAKGRNENQSISQRYLWEKELESMVKYRMSSEP